MLIEQKRMILIIYNIIISKFFSFVKLFLFGLAARCGGGRLIIIQPLLPQSIHIFLEIAQQYQMLIGQMFYTNNSNNDICSIKY